MEWVEMYENIDGCFRFFEVYARFSPWVGKHFLSMNSIGSMDVERTPSLSSIASSPRTEIGSLMRGGLFCSGLGRISSISITPAELSRERCKQEFLAQTPHVMQV